MKSSLLLKGSIYREYISSIITKILKPAESRLKANKI